MAARWLAFKDDVRLGPLSFSRESIQILHVALFTAPELEGETVMITSGCDSQHGKVSLHYVGRAYDFRIGPSPTGVPRLGTVVAKDSTERNIVAGLWAHQMAQVLGVRYDVVLETDHIHAEYDPKAPWEEA